MLLLSQISQTGTIKEKRIFLTFNYFFFLIFVVLILLIRKNVFFCKRMKEKRIFGKEALFKKFYYNLPFVLKNKMFDFF